GEQRLARVKVPDGLPRFVSPIGHLDVLHHPVQLIPLEELIAANLSALFPGMDVKKPWAFRVTRDADFEIKEDEANDLMKVLQERLRRRRFGQAVRLEIQSGMPSRLLDMLSENLSLEHYDIHESGRLLKISDFAQWLSLDLPELKFKPFVPRVPVQLVKDDIFGAIRAADTLLHHPFDSFVPVSKFIRIAARDPHVMAIKQTLYRTNWNSTIIESLLEASENGKQVAVVVELKARFDEHHNIARADQLEKAGVHVIYGAPGLKTHCKLALIVRDEGGQLRRYAHIGTGNYNSTTARVYTDLGLFTSNSKVTADVAELFNRLTGFARPAGYSRLLVAPDHMMEQLKSLILFEADEALEGRPAHIIAKCNAITNVGIINMLYEASQAGVQIDLLVRGVCCLIPGRQGLSENIVVRSVVGRFLEHARVYCFHNSGDHKVFIGSADLMTRNLKHRI
ncbi:MAG: polyphosphate kinase 1, partial [Proteobacteria bacterium]|nr:polyphosphate kinase 1 [Pseudomonadota bacterium]